MTELNTLDGVTSVYIDKIMIYVLLVLVYNTVCVNTMLRTAWQRQGQSIGYPSNSQFTPEILGENCEYIDKKKTVTSIPQYIQSCVYTWV